MLKWLERHMLPCAYKSLFGMDCPGCGFQRSVLALLRGNFHQSFLLYPAAVPVIITALFMLAESFFKLKTGDFPVKKALLLFTLGCIIVSYAVKLAYLYTFSA